MQARAAAMDELMSAGTLDDYTSNQTQLDRELAQMASQSQVESDLARMKAEIGQGSGLKAIEGGEDATAEPTESAEQKQT
jgi:phage shock protein A